MSFKYGSIVLTIIKHLFVKEKEEIAVQWYHMNKDIVNNTQNTVPKIIWLYWDNKELPKIVQICIESIRKHCLGYKINVLTPETLDNYIDLPPIVADVEPANIADLIRLMLLEKYGGIWMDASIFLTESLNWILDKMDTQDAFLFYSDECTTNNQNPISENWLIVAPEKSAFIQAWLEEYKKCILSKEPKRYYDAIKNDKALMQKLNNPDYLLCYISAIVTLKNGCYNILYASSGSTGHYFNYKYAWSPYAIATLLLLRDAGKISKPKLVKITGGVRPAISRLIRYKMFVRSSLFGRFY
ncbi:capsular polysaccharide synthesis protein [Acinetobacter junii]|uniref:capsular polysaccharide synthesis protein n=1 Tax=Acinetobacter junii TaxID=40215 RepID=UPI00124D77D1|nr:capsular polysaccharide synthesis protein [Acinetobacter junii]